MDAGSIPAGSTNTQTPTVLGWGFFLHARAGPRVLLGLMSNDPQLTSITRDDVPDRPSSTPVARTAAQRQRAYRLRRKRAVIDAIGDELTASRVTLLTLLGQELAALDTGTVPPPLIEAKRQSAKRILTAIVTRYAIDLAD